MDQTLVQLGLLKATKESIEQDLKQKSAELETQAEENGKKDTTITELNEKYETASATGRHKESQILDLQALMKRRNKEVLDTKKLLKDQKFLVQTRDKTL